MNKEKLLSESRENDLLQKKLNDYIKFISAQDRDSRGLNGTVNRFGVLTSLAKRVPILLYDHSELSRQYETAFTDGRTVFFNTEFFKTLREDEIKCKGHNIVPVILHELLHYALKHTQRDSLNEQLKTELDKYLMNIAMDSLINGITYNSFSVHGKANTPDNRRHLIKLGDEFLSTAVGMSDKERPGVKAKPADTSLTGVEGSEDSESIEKIKVAMQKVFDFCHWENTCNMSEGNIYRHIKKMLEDDEIFQEAMKEIEERNNQKSQSNPGKPQSNSKGDTEALKQAIEEMGEDYESGSHVVSPEKLRKDFEGHDIANHFAEGDEKGQKASNSKAADIVDSAASETLRQDGYSNKPGDLTGMFKERIKSKNQGLLSYEGELSSMLDYVVGRSGRLTIDSNMFSVEHYLDFEDLGLNMPICEDDRMPAGTKGTVMVLLDTSTSVSADLLAQFTADVLSMAEYLHDNGGRLVVCPADTDLKLEDVIEITVDNIAQMHEEGLPLSGFGGTSFKNTLISAGELIEREYSDEDNEISSIVYLTDGEDYAPKELPHPSLPDSISFIVPEHAVEGLDADVRSYAKVLPLIEGSSLNLGSNSPSM